MLGKTMETRARLAKMQSMNMNIKVKMSTPSTDLTMLVNAYFDDEYAYVGTGRPRSRNISLGIRLICNIKIGIIWARPYLRARKQLLLLLKKLLRYNESLFETKIISLSITSYNHTVIFEKVCLYLRHCTILLSQKKTDVQLLTLSDTFPSLITLA